MHALRTKPGFHPEEGRQSISQRVEGVKEQAGLPFIRQGQLRTESVGPQA